jgi:phosphonopyruvate decarboxylase
MLDPKAVLDELRRLGVRFFAGVPDSLLKDFCACVATNSGASEHVIAANEGNAMALAAGYHLATASVPAVYLQNSGFGNLVNPLLSLADPEVYAIPMILIVGWRGEPGVKDEPQHTLQGRLQEGLHEALRLPTRILSADSTDWSAVVSWAHSTAVERGGPVALLVRKGTFGPYKLAQAPDQPQWVTRERAIELVIEAQGPGDIIVATTGMASREVFETRKRSGQGHGNDFLTVGAMGHASSIALGIAMAAPSRTVWCIDGDGAAIMHLGAMGILGTSACENLRHVLLNNAAHDSVGGQPSVGGTIRLTDIARASGYVSAVHVDDEAGLRSALRGPAVGPAFVEMRVRKGARSDLGRPTSRPVENKTDLMGQLGSRS